LIALVGIGVVPALWLLDRLGLWLEERGWLYYRRKKPTSSPLSSLVALHQFIEPSVEHVIAAGNKLPARSESGEVWDRLLTCLREALGATPVNPEVVRLYLSHAEREGLDWRKLYAEASRGLPEKSVPRTTDVAPVE